MLLANYNSDSSDSESEPGPSRPPAKAPATTKPATAPTTSNTAKPAHVAATANLKPVKRKGPVKITLDLPKTGKASKSDDGDSGKSDEEDVPDREGGKKTAGGLKGKGTSALLGMLPPPKRKIQAPTPTVSRSASLAVNKSMAAKPRPPAGIADLSSSIRPGMNENRDHDEDDDDEGGKSGMLLPPSLARGKAKAKEEDALDLFGLSSATSGSSKAVPKSAKPPIDTISSAPLVPDFVPPEPSLSDPYPGYYQLPSGQWQAHDPEYYNSFFASGDGKGDAGKSEDDGRIGRHWDDFNTKGANFVDVDVGEGLKRGREERERLEMTKKPKLPSDEFEYKPVGQIKGLATQRHQLSSLLNDAYSQKSELEDRIAQNRKNMRLAGQKYGF